SPDPGGRAAAVAAAGRLPASSPVAPGGMAPGPLRLYRPRFRGRITQTAASPDRPGDLPPPPRTPGSRVVSAKIGATVAAGRTGAAAARPASPAAGSPTPAGCAARARCVSERAATYPGAA